MFHSNPAGAALSPHTQFVIALRDGDSAEAVRLLETGDVEARARVGAGNGEDKVWLTEMPLLFYAVIIERDEVLRALVRAGANPSKFVPLILWPGRLNGVIPGRTNEVIDGEFNAAAIAIVFKNRSALEILHRLGVNLSSVYIPSSWITVKPISAFLMAINRTNPLCLEYILDHGKRRKPQELTDLPFLIVKIGKYGSLALAVFEVLHIKRAFDFKALENLDHSGTQRIASHGIRAPPNTRHAKPVMRLTAADELLVNARASGDAGLMCFLVKKVGLISSLENMQAAEDRKNVLYSSLPSDVKENFDHGAEDSRRRAAGALSAHTRFVIALRDGDSAQAVRLLETGDVASCAKVGTGNGEDKVWLTEMPLLFYAIVIERDEVLRALVRAGANPSKFFPLNLRPGRPNEVSGEFNAAAIAIVFENPSALGILHKLGANLSSVYIPQSTVKPSSAFLLAINHTNPLCLEYILDHGERGKPQELIHFPFLIVKIGTYGSLALAVFEVLHRKRAFDFKALENLDHLGTQSIASHGIRAPLKAGHTKMAMRLTAADELLANARASGDAGLMRFLVKKAGLLSSVENVQVAENRKNVLYSSLPSDVKENFDHGAEDPRRRAAGALSPHTQFVIALRDGESAEAVRLLETGDVAACAKVGTGNGEDEVWLTEMPLLFYAVIIESGEVLRALVRAGANPCKFVPLILWPDRPNEVNGEFNAAAIAIIFENPSGLEILHKLGANLSSVYIPQSTVKPSSAFLMAINHTNPLCLEYILDHGKRGKPQELIKLPFLIVNIGTYGSLALAVFEVLHRKRAFDFKALENLNHLGSQMIASRALPKAGHAKPVKRLTAADELLANVRQSGDAGLMCFLVKKVGLVSSVENMQAAEDRKNELYWSLLSDVKVNVDHEVEDSRRRAAGADQDIHKYRCVECGLTGATFSCKPFKGALYCSAECQKKSWPDHKAGCKRLRKLIADSKKSSAGAGSSKI